MNKLKIIFIIFTSFTLIYAKKSIPKNVHKNAVFNENIKLWVYKNKNSKVYLWDKQGNISLIHSEKNNKKHGKCISFYTNGKKKIEGFYKNDKSNGLWKFWWLNGNLMAKGKYINDENHGKWIYWYENGEKEHVNIYKHGKLVYSYKIGDPARPKKVSINADWDKKEKVWVDDVFSDKCKCVISTVWYKKGNLKSIKHMTEDGLFNGKAISFYKNGNKRVEAEFKKDKRNGKWIFYNNDGTKDSEVIYKNGMKIKFKKLSNK